MKTYISTGGYRDVTASETVRELSDFGLSAFELSGGQPMQDRDVLNLLESDGLDLQIHNYFPPSDIPFVFNLASKDSLISQKSMEHAKRAIKLARHTKDRIYSFHAGFLIDPDPSNLGKPLASSNVMKRQDGLDLFMERIIILSKFASDLDVQLLIENNVLSKANHQKFDGNPLLMTSFQEALWIMERSPENVNLLLDVAHLKVSAESLGEDPVDYFTSCEKWIKAYHLSDNEGEADTNEIVRESSWFWKYLRPEVWFCTLEVYGVAPENLIAQKKLVELKFEKIRKGRLE